MEPIISTVLLIAMVGGVGTWVFMDTRKRKAATASLAAPLATRGWTLAGRGDRVAAGLSVAPFGVGSQRRCEDVIQARDKGVVSFTYRWTTGSGENKSHHARRVVMLLGRQKLPTLEVGSGKVGATAAGDQGVEQAFPTGWSVRAADGRVGHAVLHPHMIDRFMKPDLLGRSVFFEKG
ncbi:MAG: hypothetical protein HGA51_05535, partial [Demequinaceae bacterium]|nr:hypothetical protein [Demequinaceae bacterium]